MSLLRKAKAAYSMHLNKRQKQGKEYLYVLDRYISGQKKLIFTRDKALLSAKIETLMAEAGKNGKPLPNSFKFLKNPDYWKNKPELRRIFSIVQQKLEPHSDEQVLEIYNDLREQIRRNAIVRDHISKYLLTGIRK